MSVKFSDFQKLSMKVGKIEAAERILGKSKILKLTVDLGDRKATAVVGGGEFYGPEYFLGKMVVVVTNLESRKIAGVESEVMLLAADRGGRPVWLTVSDEVPAGTIVR